MIVADANLIAYLIIPGPLTSQAELALKKDPRWTAPPLWKAEIRNVLVTTMRVRQLSLQDALAAYERAVRIVAPSAEPPVAEVLSLAASSRQTAYDCEYAVTATNRGIRVVTDDRQMLKAFPEIAVSINDFLSP
jgi:predicted nucleic acid-binding protein